MRDRIQEIALYIEKFRELHEEDQFWLKELLKNGRLVLSCLDLLEAIQDQSFNYDELGSVLGCHMATARQKLSALIAGGIAIREDRDGRFVSPKTGGRPRKLIRIK